MRSTALDAGDEPLDGLRLVALGREVGDDPKPAAGARLGLAVSGRLDGGGRAQEGVGTAAGAVEGVAPGGGRMASRKDRMMSRTSS